MDSDSLDQTVILSLGDSAGLQDIPRFVKCATRLDTSVALANDIALGLSVNLRRTPTLYINGARFDGLPTRDVLDSIFVNASRR